MTVYTASSIRAFVKQKLAAERGLRQRLLASLGCQSSFLSQVFADKSHFSLEQGYRICGFFQLGVAETKFFLTMLQKEKSGSLALASFFQSQLDDLREEHARISNHVGTKVLMTPEVAARYYSNWYYAAIHILVAFDHINSKDDLYHYLRLPMNVISVAVEFLETYGFVQNVGGNLTIGTMHVHVDDRSPFISRHHLNWRQKATSIVEQNRSDNFHYTNIMGISRRDAEFIRGKVLELVQTIEPIVKDSDVERPYVLIQDFFQLEEW